MKMYTVEVRSKFPPCGEVPTIVEVLAKCETQAKDRAIYQVKQESGWTTQDGPLLARILPLVSDHV